MDHFSGIHNEFDRFRKYLVTHTGIALAENKNYLIESRLKNILTEHHLPHIDDLLRFIEGHPGAPVIDKVVDAMTTHETFWFRDDTFFNYIGYILLPTLLKNLSGQRSIEVWSAACSSGQEAYSFSMVVEQCLQNMKSQAHTALPVHILGTDISKHVITHAQSAIYSPLELSRGLSAHLLRQYFDALPGGGAKVNEKVRQRARFAVHNLMERFDTLGTFDVVMCRNVLIYFDDKIAEAILRKIHGVLRKNGVLFLSSTESIQGLNDLYIHEQTPVGLMYRAIH